MLMIGCSGRPGTAAPRPARQPAASTTARLGSSWRWTLLLDRSDTADAPEAAVGQSRQRNGSRFLAASWSLTGEPLLRSMDQALHFSTLAPFLT